MSEFASQGTQHPCRTNSAAILIILRIYGDPQNKKGGWDVSGFASQGTQHACRSNCAASTSEVSRKCEYVCVCVCVCEREREWV